MGDMVVRFQCGSCAQPIEIDDEWASKAVACPFCRKTIVAPAESTLGDLSGVPMASPLTASEGSALGTAGGLSETGGRQSISAARNVNRLALVALILAGCSAASLILTYIVLAPHFTELEELQKTMSSATSVAETMQAQTAFFEVHPQALLYVMAASMLMIVAGLTSLAGIVCALIALRCPYRRGLAVTALLVASAVPMFFCCGSVVWGATG